MTESKEVQDEIVERACRVWWDNVTDGRRVATVSWDEYSRTHDVGDYRVRMRKALIEIGAIP